MALGGAAYANEQHSNQIRQLVLPKVELQPTPFTKETGLCLVAALTTTHNTL